jgi:dUTP pyrophosphatase
MEVKVKFTNDKAKELYLKASKGESEVPYKTHNDDFCYDVVATSCEEVAPNVYKYGLGLAFQIVRNGWEKLVGCKSCNYDFTTIKMDTNYENLSIDFRPRSSVWKTGMSLSNCEGTIDEGYINEVSAVFYHLMPNMPKYEVGDRIGQIKIGVTMPIEFIEVEELDETSRGMGGFGSTGK